MAMAYIYIFHVLLYSDFIQGPYRMPFCALNTHMLIHVCPPAAEIMHFSDLWCFMFLSLGSRELWCPKTELCLAVCLTSEMQIWWTGEELIISEFAFYFFRVHNLLLMRPNIVFMWVFFQIDALSRSSGDAVLKFEPFVLHVQCRKLEDAQLMVVDILIF